MTTGGMELELQFSDARVPRLAALYKSAAVHAQGILTSFIVN